MQDQLDAAYLETLRHRVLDPEGGFADKNGGGYRADATAWAAMALQAMERRAEWLNPARSRLAARQSPDGRVSLSPQHPDAFWPTPLAILAWRRSPEHGEARARAVSFLLTATGVHWRRGANYPFEHDPALQGWPWIAATHSWVEPTALAILALRVSGRGEHPRVREGVRLLLDRQLPRGGWNYGNTRVFGQELSPFPESTGLALSALRGAADKSRVRKSLDYLHSQLQGVRTPLSLGWGLMGLAAWGENPPGAKVWIGECLERQKRYGVYDTASLSLLIVASRAPGGLESVFASQCNAL